MKRVVFLLGVLCLVCVACGGGSDPVPDAAPPPDAGDPNPIVVITTSEGVMKFELSPVHMPNTTTNFLGYVDSGFYDNTLIHHVQEEWILRGGAYDPGMVAKTPGDPIALEQSTEVRHVAGALSMFHEPNLPDTATSEWLIVHWPNDGRPPQQTAFDRDLAAFGILTEGNDVLNALAGVDTGGEPDYIPTDELVITSIARE